MNLDPSEPVPWGWVEELLAALLEEVSVGNVPQMGRKAPVQVPRPGGANQAQPENVFRGHEAIKEMARKRQRGAAR